MDIADHGQRQRAPTRQDFGDARPRSEERLELLSGPTELLATQGDRFDGRERVNWECPTLVRIDESRERVELALLTRTRLGVPQPLDAPKGFLVSGGIYDGLNHFCSDLVRIDAVVLRVSSHETYEDEKEGVVLDLRDQAIGVAFDIENNPIVLQEVGGTKDGTDLRRTGPCRPFDHREPETKGSLSIGVFLPKLDEGVPTEDAQRRVSTMLPGREQGSTIVLRRAFPKAA
jgi:hypothetical protein